MTTAPDSNSTEGVAAVRSQLLRVVPGQDTPSGAAPGGPPSSNDNMVAKLLADQADLSAVEAFAAAEQIRAPEEHKRYQQLLPAAPGARSTICVRDRPRHVYGLQGVCQCLPFVKRTGHQRGLAVGWVDSRGRIRGRVSTNGHVQLSPLC